MKTKKLLCWALVIGAMFAISACSSSDDSESLPNPPNNGGLSNGTAVKPVNMTMAALSGFVYDDNGNALSGVSVTSGTEKVVTASDGGFTLNNVNTVGGRSIVKFSHYGYLDIVRSVNTTNGDVWEVVMVSSYMEDYTASLYQPIRNAASMNTTSGMKVDFPSNAFKYAETGETVNDNYEYSNCSMFYLSPDMENFAAMMPGGDLAAVRTDNSPAQLVSYGMTLVNLRSSYGKDLQLAEGKTATLHFPVPEKFKDNTPATIPLWSFNEETGLWEEEGEATYDENSKTYVGTVSHFSWVNLDYPEKRATLKVVVKDQAGNAVPNVRVSIDGQRESFTNTKGEIECFVPTNTDFYVTIKSEDYCNYTPEIKENVSAITTAGDTKTVQLILPTVAHISGKVMNSGKGNSLGTLWIEYNGKSLKKVHTDSQGQFYMNAPANYTGAGKLMLRASDGSIKSYDITLDGKDHAYTISIDTDESTGGSLSVTVNNQTKTYLVPPVYYEEMNGVSIVDNILAIDVYGEESGCYLYIDNYSESKDTYTGVNISLSSSDGRIECKNGATVKVSNNKYNNYTFQISGTGTTYANKEEVNATFTGKFVAPLLAKGKQLKSVKNKSPEWPSFTPWLNGKTVTTGLQATEGRFGTGVMLWYFGQDLGYADYLNLKKQAQQALGEPVSCNDSGDTAPEGGGDMSVAYFFKDKQFVMVSYCPWRDDTEEEALEHYQLYDFSAIRETHAARIHVHAFQNMEIDYTDLLREHWK